MSSQRDHGCVCFRSKQTWDSTIYRMPLLWFQNCEVMHGCSKNTFFELERSDIITTLTPYLGVASCHSLQIGFAKQLHDSCGLVWLATPATSCHDSHTHRFQVGNPTPDGVAFAMGDFPRWNSQASKAGELIQLIHLPLSTQLHSSKETFGRSHLAFHHDQIFHHQWRKGGDLGFGARPSEDLGWAIEKALICVVEGRVLPWRMLYGPFQMHSFWTANSWGHRIEVSVCAWIRIA